MDADSRGVVAEGSTFLRLPYFRPFLLFQPIQLKIVKKSILRNDKGTQVRSMVFKAMDGKAVQVSVSVAVTPLDGDSSASRPDSLSIDLTLADFQLLKTHLGVSIPWLTGWMQQLNPLSFTELNEWKEFVPYTPRVASQDTAAAGEDG
jgi:hypothetical protein